MKRWMALCMAALCLSCLFGCGTAPASGVPAEANKVTFPEKIAFEDYDARWAVREENPVSDGTIARVNGFAYRSADVLLSGASGNANYSPLSLYYALALLSEGAADATLAELSAALCGGDAGEAPGAELGNLMRRLYTDNEVAKLKIANSVWLREGVSFGEAFCRTAAEDYYAALFTADFGDGATGKAIGKWISDQTGGLLAPEVELSPEQIMVLLNTVYFQDQWMDEFDEAGTAEGTFHAPEGDTTARFMHALRRGDLVRGEGFTRASLPLKNAGSMTFLLPDADTDVAALLGQHGLQALLETGEATLCDIEWALPKFSFDSAFDLVPMLKALGVTSAFREDAALDGITADAYVSAVKQETHIGIDEKGVEAAAFTRIDVAGAGMVEPPRVAFTLERPFLFAVTAAGGALLFVGIVSNPAA